MSSYWYSELTPHVLFIVASEQMHDLQIFFPCCWFSFLISLLFSRCWFSCCFIKLSFKEPTSRIWHSTVSQATTWDDIPNWSTGSSHSFPIFCLACCCCPWEGGRWCPKYLGTCHPCGKPRWDSCLLFSVTHTWFFWAFGERPSRWDILPIWKILLSFSLSVTPPFE